MKLTDIMTEERKARMEAHLSRIAGEPVEFDYSESGCWYGFTAGELGMYRLADKYKCRKGWSENLGKFYIQVELEVLE